MSSDIELVSTAEGVLLPVRAQPGARRKGIVGVHNGRLKVAVTQVAERGKANEAVLEVLVETLGLRSSQIELISGMTNREKTVLISAIDVESLRERLAMALSPK